jgi:hypothetical protein
LKQEKESFVETAPRTPLFIDVDFRKNYAREGSAGKLKNISLSGAFLQHQDPTIRVGEKIAMEIKVSGRHRVLDAVVVWTSATGSGVRFNHSNNRDRQIVDDLIYFVEAKRTDTRDIMDMIFKKVA